MNFLRAFDSDSSTSGTKSASTGGMLFDLGPVTTKTPDLEAGMSPGAQGSDDKKDSDSDNCREQLSRGDPGMRMLRVLAYTTLLCAAVLVSSMVWLYSGNAERREFEQKFESQSAHIGHALFAETASKVSSIETVANTIYAQQSITGETGWPFTTLPQFTYQALGAMIIARVQGIALVPVVDQEHREEWDQYSVQHEHQWRSEGLDFQNRFPDAFRDASGGGGGHHGGHGGHRHLMNMGHGDMDMGNMQDMPMNHETSHDPMDSSPAPHELMEISRSIFHVVNENTSVALGGMPAYQRGEGPFYPLWQHFPNHLGFPWINFDLHQTNAPEIDTTVQSGKVVLGHFFDLAMANHGLDLPYVDPHFKETGHINSPEHSHHKTMWNNETKDDGGDDEHHGSDSGAHETKDHGGDDEHHGSDSGALDQGPALKDHGGDDEHHGSDSGALDQGPALTMWYPIFDDVNAHAQRQVVALLMVTVKWDSFFLPSLPPNPIDLRVVIHNPCGQIFTLMIDTNDDGVSVVEYLGAADYHEPKYDSYRKRTTLAFGGTPVNNVPLNSEYCPWTVDVYPSTKLENTFSGNNPVFLAAIVASLFAFVVIVFLAYDYFGNHRRTYLRNLAQEKNSDYMQANNQLAIQAGRQLEHFACMSHEIRTPLNCIVGLSSLLLDSPDEELSSHALDNVRMMNASAELLHQVVDDVLDYARMESGNMVVDCRKIDLQETLSSVLVGLGTRFEQKELKINVKYGATLPREMPTDPRRLQQILYNLLSNACKFSKEGSPIDFTVVLEERRCAGPVVKISIKDYGKGIKRDSFESIFQPFSKASKETQNLYGGTGLGLSISKNLVESLGGRISVDSVEGKFTEFVLELPFQGTPVDVETMKSRLQNTAIVFVSNDIGNNLNPFSDEVVKMYNVDLIRASSLTEVDPNAMGSRFPGKAITLVLPSDGLDDLDQLVLLKELSKSTGQLSLVTYGDQGCRLREEYSTCSAPIEAADHWGEIRNVFPSVALESVSSASEAVPFKRRSMDGSCVSGRSSDQSIGESFHSYRSRRSETIGCRSAPKPLFTTFTTRSGVGTTIDVDELVQPERNASIDVDEFEQSLILKSSSPPNTTTPPAPKATMGKGKEGSVPPKETPDSCRSTSTPMPLFSSAYTPAQTKPLFGIPPQPESVPTPAQAKPLFGIPPQPESVPTPAQTKPLFGLPPQPEPVPTPAQPLSGIPPQPEPVPKQMFGTRNPPTSKSSSEIVTTAAANELDQPAICMASPLPKTKMPPKPMAGKSTQGVASPKAAPNKRKAKVLYAEDNKINQKVLSRMLTRLGANEHDIVDDGKQALEISAQKQYDVIFMDIQMPVMDGLEATRRIKERDGDLAKIIFCTAHAVNDFREQALESGGDGFVPKPFNLKTIASVLDQYEPI